MSQTHSQSRRGAHQIQQKYRTLQAALEGIDDEDTTEEILDAIAGIEADIQVFTEPDGDLILLRQILEELPADELCRCIDPLCPPHDERVPIEVKHSRKSVPVALQEWDSRHDGARLYQQFNKQRAEKRERCLKILSEQIAKARAARSAPSAEEEDPAR